MTVASVASWGGNSDMKDGGLKLLRNGSRMEVLYFADKLLLFLVSMLSAINPAHTSRPSLSLFSRRTTFLVSTTFL